KPKSAPLPDGCFMRAAGICTGPCATPRTKTIRPLQPPTGTPSRSTNGVKNDPRPCRHLLQRRPRNPRCDLSANPKGASVTDVSDFGHQRLKRQPIASLEKGCEDRPPEIEGIAELRKRRDEMKIESFIKMCVEVCDDELRKIAACVGVEAAVAVIDALST